MSDQRTSSDTSHTTDTSTSADHSTAVRPFRVDIPAADVADLQRRLATTRLPRPAPAPAGAADSTDSADDWTYGVSNGYLTRMLDRWQHEFSWEALAERINGYPQYTT